MKLDFEDLPPMEVTCSYCDKGEIEESYTVITKQKTKKKKIKYTCTHCGGRGILLTDFGTAILKLISDWNPLENRLSDMESDIRRLNP